MVAELPMHPARVISATTANDVAATRKVPHGHRLRASPHTASIASPRMTQTTAVRRNGRRRKTASRHRGALRPLARLPAWVATLTENGTAAVLTSNAEAGTEQVASAGVPAQAMDTSPVNPFSGAIERP